jgi:hypothetical protein
MPTVANITDTAQQDAKAAAFLQKLEALVEKFAPVVMPLLIVLFSVWAWFASREVRLWYDELLELTVASASSSRELLATVAAGDHNPPLSHFLIRASISLLGDTEWAARFPAYLGMVTMLVAIYFFVSRWLTRSYGILAMLVLMCLPIRIYAIQARPYGLVLGFSALALLFYQQTLRPSGRRLALLGLAVCAGCLTATHYYAVLVIGSILMVDVLRTWGSKRLDWALFACMGIPPLIVLGALRNVIREQRAGLSHYFASGNLLSFDHGYDTLDLDPLVYCVALIAVTLLLSFYLSHGTFRTPVHFPLVGTHEAVLGASLLLLPILGAFCSQFVTHAYLARYFVASAIGLSLCVCFSVRLLSAGIPGLLILLILPLGLGFGKALMVQGHRSPEQLPPGAALASATAPILIDNPGSYLLLLHYFPDLHDALWVIADPAASLYYRKYSTDDELMLTLAARGRAQTITLKAAARKWSHFSLIPRPGDSVWALKCVIEAGANVTVERTFGDTNFVFDVRVPPESLALIDACSAGASGL